MQVRKNILAISIVAALGVSGTVAAQDAPKTDPKDLEPSWSRASAAAWRSRWT